MVLLRLLLIQLLTFYLPGQPLLPSFIVCLLYSEAFELLPFLRLVFPASLSSPAEPAHLNML